MATTPMMTVSEAQQGYKALVDLADTVARVRARLTEHGATPSTQAEVDAFNAATTLLERLQGTRSATLKLEAALKEMGAY